MNWNCIYLFFLKSLARAQRCRGIFKWCQWSYDGSCRCRSGPSFIYNDNADVSVSHVQGSGLSYVKLLSFVYVSRWMGLVDYMWRALQYPAVQVYEYEGTFIWINYASIIMIWKYCSHVISCCCCNFSNEPIFFIKVAINPIAHWFLYVICH